MSNGSPNSYGAGIGNIESINQLTTALTTLNIALRDTVTHMGAIASIKMPNIGGIGSKVKVGADVDIEKSKNLDKYINSFKNLEANMALGKVSSKAYADGLNGLITKTEALGLSSNKTAGFLTTLGNKYTSFTQGITQKQAQISAKDFIGSTETDLAKAGSGIGKYRLGFDAAFNEATLINSSKQLKLLSTQFQAGLIDQTAFSNGVNKLIGNVSRLGGGINGSAQSIASMQKALRQATLGTGEFDVSMDKVSHKLRSFNILMGTAFSVAMLKTFIASSVQEFAKLELGVANVTTLLNDADTKQYGKVFTLGIRRMAIETGKPIEELAKGLYDINSSAVTAAQSMNVLELATKAAIAGQTTISTAVKVGLATINAYGLSIKDLGMVFNKQFASVKVGIYTYEEFANSLQYVQSSAKVAGVSLDDLYSAMAFLTRAGLSAERATIGLQHIFDRLIQNTEKFNEIASVFDAVGGKLKPLPQLFKSLADGLSALPSLERLRAMRELVPDVRGLRAFLLLIDGWSNYEKTVREYLDSIVKANEEAYAKIANTTATELSRMGAMWTDFKISVAEWEPVKKSVEAFIGFVGTKFKAQLKQIEELTMQIPAIDLSKAMVTGELKKELSNTINSVFNDINIKNIVLPFKKGMFVEGFLDLYKRIKTEGELTYKDLFILKNQLENAGAGKALYTAEIERINVLLAKTKEEVSVREQARDILREMNDKQQKQYSLEVDTIHILGVGTKEKLTYGQVIKRINEEEQKGILTTAKLVKERFDAEVELHKELVDLKQQTVNLDDTISKTINNNTEKWIKNIELRKKAGEITEKEGLELEKQVSELETILQKRRVEIQLQEKYRHIENLPEDKQKERYKELAIELNSVNILQRGFYKNLIGLESDYNSEILKGKAKTIELIKRGEQEDYKNRLQYLQEYFLLAQGYEEKSYVERYEILQQMKKDAEFKGSSVVQEEIAKMELALLKDMTKKKAQLILDEKKKSARLELDIEKEKLNEQLKVQKDFLNNLRGIYTKGMPSLEEIRGMKPSQLKNLLYELEKQAKESAKGGRETQREARIAEAELERKKRIDKGLEYQQEQRERKMGLQLQTPEKAQAEKFDLLDKYYINADKKTREMWDKMSGTEEFKRFQKSFADFNDTSFAGTDTLKQLNDLEDRLNVTRNESIKNIDEYIKKYGELSTVFKSIIPNLDMSNYAMVNKNTNKPVETISKPDFSKFTIYPVNAFPEELQFSIMQMETNKKSWSDFTNSFTKLLDTWSKQGNNLDILTKAINEYNLQHGQNQSANP